MKNGSNKRKTVGVIFGGRSVEHEISVITGLQLIRALDVERYDVIPIYIAPNGHWYVGEQLLERSFYKGLPGCLNELTEVTLLPVPDSEGVTVIGSSAETPVGRFSRAEQIPIDVYFLAFHGEFGEDGCVQGLMELADAAYTGGGVLSSSVAMDKYICKSVLHDHGIPVLPGVVVRKEDALKDFDSALKSVFEGGELKDFPVFVKPCHLGSSIGIAKAENEVELRSALALVFRHDNSAIVEPFLSEMFEINVSILEEEEPVASVVEIPVSASGVLSYEDKYLREGASKKTGEESGGMANLTRDIDPQHLDPAIKERVIGYAKKAVRVLECSGIVRFDFMYDTKTDNIYFNELNPMPGSFAFYLWVKSHPPLLYTEVLSRAIERAMERKSIKSSLIKELEFRALAQ
ncbi:MAG: hypothetical protein KDD66_10765 [Bdellovibrionales bacterium]|nr:hypothetical protein [Bdellovibrionales bacterium]